MASITMTASFLSSSTTTILGNQTARRTPVVANASSGEKVKMGCDTKRESSNGRRDLMFAAVAAAACSVAGIAVADELKAGTPEARKFYAPVCVTMPTARICHK